MGIFSPGIIRAAAEPDIPITANLLMHFRSDKGVTKDGSDFVSSWKDQIGSRDLTVATNKPKWFDNQVNSYPSIRFDGTNDYLSESGGTIAQPAHVWMIVKQKSWSSGDCLIGGVTSPSADIQQSASSSRTRIEIDNFGPELNTPLNLWFLLGALIASPAKYFYNDGVIATGGTGTNTFNGGITLGAERSGWSFANIEVAELAIYTILITGGDRTTLMNYFNDRYIIW